jgi:PAS domain S-box-containing protein
MDINKSMLKYLTVISRRTITALLVMLAAGIDWFIPSSVRKGDVDLFRRARLTVTFVWTLIILANIYAAIFFLMNSPIGTATLAIGGCIGFALLGLMRRTGSSFLTINLLNLNFFVVLTVLACRYGGQSSFVLAWYAAVPVVALSTAGRRSAVSWLTVTILSLAVFHAFDISGYSFPNDLTHSNYKLLSLFAWLGLTVLLLGLTFLYEAAMARMLRLVRESQQRYRAVVEDTPLLICTYLPDTTLTYVNEAYCRYFERSREALLGRSFLDLILEQDHAAVREMIASMVATPGVRVSEYRVSGPDGAEVWLRWTNRAIFDPKGRSMMCQAIGEDITERKQAEAKLRREKEVADDIINSLPGLFYVLNAEGRIVRWNDRWLAVTGYSEGEMGVKLATDFFEGADKALIADRMMTVLREGAANAEAEIVTKNGRKIPYYFTGLRRNFDGKPHIVGLGIDITRQKHTEAELARARNAAEAATHAKSEFLANMSHEIRTPMTAILGFSDILMESVSDRERLDAASTIKRNGEYLIRIINDILDLSKIEAGKMDVEHIRCSLCQILAEVAELMRVRANAKNLPLEIEYEGPIPQNIRSDPTRLRQILINLTSNAIKFTEVGTVRLVTRLLDAESAEPKIQFDVVDSGVGMTVEQIVRLFRPFHQADTSTTRKFGGTGLGLTISKRLAKKLGGDIAVKSTYGEGSTFTVTVGTGPLDGVVLLDNPPKDISFWDDIDTPPAKAKLDCRVLLAEDGPDNQRLISFLLKRAGAEVVLAENGQIALDLALAARNEGRPFDVILMDMQMPVMDGYNATGKLRAAGYEGPIIALTAHTMSTDRDKCLAAGCDDYMIKPIDREMIIATVAQYALLMERRE